MRSNGAACSRAIDDTGSTLIPPAPIRRVRVAHTMSRRLK
jgi:hypothetical protein